MTLVTCTPYAINTHRLLVRGKRIPYKEAKKKEEANAKKNIPIYIILLIGGIIAILFIYAAIRIKEVRRRKRKNKRNIIYLCMLCFLLVSLQRLEVFAQSYGSFNIVAAVSKNLVTTNLLQSNAL